MTETEHKSPDEAEPKQTPKKSTRPMSRNRCKWLCLTWSFTWWIPSIFLYYCGGMRTRAVREAWREKVAICMLFFLLSCSMLFLLIGFGPVICPKEAGMIYIGFKIIAFLTY